MQISAVIAAAGLSARMQAFKPMLCLGNQTIITTVIQTLRAAGTGEIAVVTGYRSDLLRRHLAQSHVTICENPRYAETDMFDSLCLGLRALREPYDLVFLTPGDAPLVRVDTLRAMARLRRPIVRPVCGGRAGHPIAVARETAPSLLEYRGGNGLRGALAAMHSCVTDLPVEDPGILADVDTPADYKALFKQDALQKNGGNLWPDVRIHIARGDAVLTPETAQFLEMIAHTGSIQSACSCMHMSYTKGWKLLNRIEAELGWAMVERSPGGNHGGGSSLTEKGWVLLDAYQRYCDALHKTAGELFRQMFPPELFREE